MSGSGWGDAANNDLFDTIEAEIDAEIAAEEEAEKSRQLTPPPGDNAADTTAASPAPQEEEAALAQPQLSATSEEIERRIREEVEATVRAEYEQKVKAEMEARLAAERERAEAQLRELEEAAKAQEEARRQAAAAEAARKKAEAKEAARREKEAAEAAAKAEAEAKARAKAEAKAKAEADARAKAAEEKARAEAEAKAKADAEAKAKAEAEARANAEAEAARAAEEAARREKEAAEAAAKAKVEAEAKARAEAEAKAKAAAEAKAKALTDAKAAEEQARRQATEKLRAEAAEKARREMEAAVERQRAEYEAKIRAMQEKLQKSYTSATSDASEASASGSAAAPPEAAAAGSTTNATAAAAPRTQWSSDEDDSSADEKKAAKPASASPPPRTPPKVTKKEQPAATAAPAAPAAKKAPTRDIRKMAAAAAKAAAASPVAQEVAAAHAPPAVSKALKAVAPAPADESDEDDVTGSASSASFASEDSGTVTPPAPTAAAPVVAAAKAAKAAKGAAAAKGAKSKSPPQPAPPVKREVLPPVDELAANIPPPSQGTLQQLFSNALPDESIDLPTETASGAKLPQYSWGSYPPETFEAMAVQKPANVVEVHKSDIPREVGRSVGPVNGEPGAAPDRFSHQKVAVDFFATQQTMVEPTADMQEWTAWAAEVGDQKDPAKRGVNRELFKSDKGRASLVDAKLAFEVGGDKEDAEAVKAAASEAAIVPEAVAASDPASAVERITTKYTEADVLQLYDASRFMQVAKGDTMAKIWTHDYEPRKPTNMPSMFRDGILYTINVKECATALQTQSGPDVEPTMGSLAIYVIGLKETKKISETFYFDVNTGMPQSPYFKPGGAASAGPSPAAQKGGPHQCNRLRRFATFIPNQFRSAELYAVLRLHRLGTDDHDSAMDMYIRPGSWRKEKKHFDGHVKRLQEYTEASSQLRELTTEVAWIASPLKAAQGPYTGESVIDKLWVTPRFVVTSDSALQDVVTHQRWKAYKLVSCRVVLDCQDMTKAEVMIPRSGTATAAAAIEEESMLLLRTNPDAPQELVRHCPTVFPVLNAGFFHSFCNAMYVNLQRLELSRLATKEAKEAKHFVIKVALKDNDIDLFDSDGIPCVFSRWFGQHIISNCGWSQVSVGQKDCDLADEIKIQLPLVLTPKHHLLFTVFAVSVEKTGKPKPLVPIAYAFKPVFDNRRVLAASPQALPVIVGGPSAAALKANYLTNKNVSSSSYVSDGAKVLRFTTSLRSTVYPEVPVLADIFNDYEPILKLVTNTDKGDVFATGGVVRGHRVESNSETAITRRLSEIESLAQPEKLAFYPRLASFLLSIVCGASMHVGIQARCLAFKAFARLSSEIHAVESATVRTPATAPRPGQPAPKPPVVLTAPVKYVYHYLTDNILHDEHRFNLALGVTEVLTGEIVRSRKVDRLATYKVLLGNYLWLFYDIILKGIYLHAARKAQSAGNVIQRKHKNGTVTKTVLTGGRSELFKEDFYDAIFALVDEVVEGYVKGDARTVVTRTSLFLRHVCLVADRGHTLNVFQAFMRRLIGKQCIANIDYALSTFTEGALSLATMLGPRVSLDASARGVVRVMLRRVLPLMWDNARDNRDRGQKIMHRFVARAARQPRLIGEDSLQSLAQSLLSFVAATASVYLRMQSIINKDSVSNSASSAFEHRNVLSLNYWVLQNAPQQLVHSFVSGMGEQMLTGFLAMLRDAFNLFRHDPARLKVPPQATLNDKLRSEIAPWDGRFEAQMYTIGVRLLSTIAAEHGSTALRGVSNPTSQVSSMFMAAVDCALDVAVPTQLLQAGCCVLRQLVNDLAVDLLSGRAPHAQCVISCALHLMTSVSPAVRESAAQSLLHFARRHFELFGDLARFRVLVLEEVIAVAENDCKMRPRAADSFSSALAKLADQCGESWAHLRHDDRQRFVAPAEAAAGGAEKATKKTSSPLAATNTVRGGARSTTDVFGVPAGADEANRRVAAARGVPDFASNFERMIDASAEFFVNVSRMATTKTHEVQVTSMFELVKKLLKQRSLAEALRWLQELVKVHAKVPSGPECGMTTLAIAAIVFRATQMYYHIFGAKGSPTGTNTLPPEILGHIAWHDFTRVMPELDGIVSEDEMHLIVAEQVNLPDLSLFSVQGFKDTLREAAERLARAYFYELAVPVMHLVERLAIVTDDHHLLATASDDVRKWATALTRGTTSRLNADFFAITVYGAQLTDSVQWILRYPEVTKMSLDGFRKIAAGIALAVTGCAEADLEMNDSMSPEEMIQATEDAKAAAIKRANSSKKRKTPSAKTAEAEARARKVYVACHQVKPWFAESDPRSTAKAGPMTALNLDAVSCRVMITDRNAEEDVSVQALGLAFSMNDEARNFKPHARRQRIVVHKLARPLPSLTSAVPVDSAEESTLDPVATAIADIRQQHEIIASITNDLPPMVIVKRAIAALTPLSIRPAGFYLKAVLHTLGDDPELRDAAKLVVDELRDKSTIISNAAMKDPDTFAKYLKATVDVECAYSDAVAREEARRRAEAGEDVDEDSDALLVDEDDEDGAARNSSMAGFVGADEADVPDAGVDDDVEDDDDEEEEESSDEE